MFLPGWTEKECGSPDNNKSAKGAGVYFTLAEVTG